VMQVPTTLLAQVDSSIGGKTGIDLPSGKNLVGAFHQPAAVVMDTSVLGTLPRVRMAEGMAEVVKYGCIADEDLFNAVETGFLDLDWLVERCVRIKTGVVSRDEKDTGERMLLNFGHTVGHAVEKASGFALSHGESVAVGMTAASRIGERLGVTPHGTSDRLEAVLARQGLPTRAAVPLDAVAEAMASDKKRLTGRIHFVFLERIGEAALHPMPLAELVSLLKEVSVLG
jgi:3-dehydroquinate synthase